MNNEELKIRIGANIARLRKKAGLTQAELAERLNYSDKAVSKWERAESMPDVLTLMLLAEQFGTDVNELLYENQEKPAAQAPEHKSMSEKVQEALPKLSKLEQPVADKKVILKLSSILVWVVALFIYLVLDAFGMEHCWMVYVLAVIANAIVLLSLRSAWKMFGWNRILISVIMWGTLLFFYLTVFLAWGISVWRVFLIGLLGQAAIILWFKMFRKPEEDNNGQA